MDGDDIIPAHLIHHGYEDTLKSFERSEVSVAELTNSILNSANEKKWLNVIDLLQARLPDALEVNPGLLFDLLCMEYIKLVCSKDRMGALMFAREHFPSFRELKIYEKIIEDCMILLGFEELDQISPPPVLLTAAYQEQVTNKLRETVQFTLASVDPLLCLKISDEEIQEVRTRKQILECVSNDQVEEAVRLTEQAFPGLLENNKNLRFHLSTLEFFQIVKSNNGEEMVKFSREHFNPLMDDPNYFDHIKACMATMATVVSPETPYLLTDAYRQHIAYKLNMGMRAYGKHPTHSKLQSLIKHVLAVQQQLEKDRGTDVVVTPSSLKDILKDKDTNI